MILRSCGPTYCLCGCIIYTYNHFVHKKQKLLPQNNIKNQLGSLTCSVKLTDTFTNTNVLILSRYIKYKYKNISHIYPTHLSTSLYIVIPDPLTLDLYFNATTGRPSHLFGKHLQRLLVKSKKYTVCPQCYMNS